jgi:hypothetical protein
VSRTFVSSSLTFSEYEDGRVVWSIVDALRTDDADTDLYDYHRWSTQSRGTSIHSSRRESEPEPETSIPDVFGGTRWAGTQGLNLRQRETTGQRPETNVSRTRRRVLTPGLFHFLCGRRRSHRPPLARPRHGKGPDRHSPFVAARGGLHVELFAVSLFRRPKRRGLHRVGFQRSRASRRGSVRRRAFPTKRPATPDQPGQTRRRARSGI